MSIKALIFDFDGLILETETPIFQSWQELYRAHGCEIPMEAWANIIGASDNPYWHEGDVELIVKMTAKESAK